MKLGLNLWNTLSTAIKTRGTLPKNMQIVHTWSFGKNAPHAGQILQTKTLQNGNLQKRMVTVYGNTALGLETAVYSPSGEFLKAYAGVRSVPYKGTESITSRYASGSKDDVGAVVRSMYDHQGGAKSILF